jgi:hypothetical protein
MRKKIFPVKKKRRYAPVADMRVRRRGLRYSDHERPYDIFASNIDNMQERAKELRLQQKEVEDMEAAEKAAALKIEPDFHLHEIELAKQIIGTD